MTDLKERGSLLRSCTAAALWAMLGLLAGCEGKAEEKLNEVLAGIALIDFDDVNVVAKCKNAEIVVIEKGELGMNFLGMASPEGLQKVATQIQSSCEAKKEEAEQQTEDQKRFTEECKKQKLKCGDTVDEMRETLCKKLASELPLRGERRDKGIISNERNWGCGDPGAPPELPTGFWEVERDGRGRAQVVSLKLDSSDDDLDGFARLTVRCNKGKLEGYVAETFKLDRTKALVGQADKKKTKWPAAMSTDQKAIFLKDAKKAAGDLRGKSKLSVTYKNAKRKKVTRSFDVKGFDAAAKQLGRCRI